MSTRLFLFFVLLAAALWTSGAGARGSTQTWVEATDSAPSCTLDVVLVTFDDATTQASETAYDYHEPRPTLRHQSGAGCERSVHAARL